MTLSRGGSNPIFNLGAKSGAEERPPRAVTSPRGQFERCFRTAPRPECASGIGHEGDAGQATAPAASRHRSRRHTQSERERRARKRAEDGGLPTEVRDELQVALGPDRSAGLERRLAIPQRVRTSATGTVRPSPSCACSSAWRRMWRRFASSTA